MIAPSFSLCAVVPELMVISGIFLSVTFFSAPCRTLKSAMVVITPSTFCAAACSIRRAMSARSPLAGLRYSTVTP